MPWLTPDSIPEDDDCRPLSIPADTVWLSLVSGALTELTKPYNWQKFGTLTVQETVDKMQAIIDSYYSSPCAMCTTPGGYRVTRISPSGHVEQLDPSGNWIDATDEYHIPPPDAREGGTEADQNCLAAKNAVNVLEQLYENLTDSWNENLSAAEAATAFILGAIGLVSFEFAPITWSIIAFLTPVFTALYSALAFLGADLWDENVTKQLECFLLECAVNTAGVVTFDWDCFNHKMNSLSNDFSLTETQLRLYLQVAFMLYFIGGADGLNLAGRTTEITSADCSFCPSSGGICVGFDETDIFEFYPEPEFPDVPTGHLNNDFGNPAPSGLSDENFSYGNYQLWTSVRIDLIDVREVVEATFQYFWYSDSAGGSIFRAIYFLDEAETIISQQTTASTTMQSAWLDYEYTGSPVSGVRYIVAVLGQTSGALITGNLTIDNICATW